LWYNTTTGQVVIWFLNGSSVIGGGSPGSAGSPFTVAGTGAFNGDGKSDILWYNTTTGQGVIWVLNRRSGICGRSPRFGGEHLYHRPNRRFQRRRQERHPLVQYHDRTSCDLVAQRRERDRRRLAWLGNDRLAGSRHQRRLIG